MAHLSKCHLAFVLANLHNRPTPKLLLIRSLYACQLPILMDSLTVDSGKF
jgi:hypothetical protein